MESFKKYYLYFVIGFFYSFIYSSNNNINNIIKISFIDFSVIDNNEFQFNFGSQFNNEIDFHYFSIDKLISHNLIISIKISRFKNENIQIYNQNSFSFISDKTPFNFLVALNNILSQQRINRWINLGILLDHKITNKHKFFTGIYFDISNLNDELWSNTNYYLSFKFKLIKNLESLIAIKYDPYNSISNHSLKFSVTL